jgi:cytochrome c-type biogenesis protein CcmH/NrfG
LLDAAQKLLNEKKNEDAAIILAINAQENPQSYRVYFALGEAYFRAGKKELARKNFEKSLEINPKNYDVLFRMEQLEQVKQ